eukprot:4369637-Pyramimonas_sp.AAC.1
MRSSTEYYFLLRVLTVTVTVTVTVPAHNTTRTNVRDYNIAYYVGKTGWRAIRRELRRASKRSETH